MPGYTPFLANTSILEGSPPWLPRRVWRAEFDVGQNKSHQHRDAMPRRTRRFTLGENDRRRLTRVLGQALDGM